MPAYLVPGADLLSALIAVEEQGDRLKEGELIAMCVMLFIAGHETSANMISNGLYALLQNPDQLGISVQLFLLEPLQQIMLIVFRNVE